MFLHNWEVKMKKMKFYKLAAICLIFVIQVTAVYAGEKDIAYETAKINGKSVKFVTVNAGSKDIHFGVIKANDEVKGWETFSSMMKRKQPLAAINGNFFNAYAKKKEDIVPWGYIYDKGKMINSGATLNHGSFAVLKDGSIVIDDADNIDKEQVWTMVEAGPLLVKEGKVVFNPNDARFKEDKINKISAQRSAIGLREDGKVIMLTGNSLKTKELALIMQKLKCKSATNLDGGASSALYAKSKYLTSPGRNLNTVLAVYQGSEEKTE